MFSDFWLTPLSDAKLYMFICSFISFFILVCTSKSLKVYTKRTKRKQPMCTVCIKRPSRPKGKGRRRKEKTCLLHYLYVTIFCVVRVYGGGGS